MRSRACYEKDLTEEVSPLSRELEVGLPILLRNSSFYLMNC